MKFSFACLLVATSAFSLHSPTVSPTASRRPACVALLQEEAGAAAAAAAAGCEWEIRLATEDELPAVAELQLDVFAEPGETPVLLPMLAGLFEARQRGVRLGMRQRLTAELVTRLQKGSQILVAVPVGADASSSVGLVEPDGSYAELGPPMLGTVDLSTQEMQLPTHALAEGCYLSHMAVAEPARRRGIARSLMQRASALAAASGEEGIWLHVEKDNAAAVSLYESEGFVAKPEVPPYVGFTQALNLAHREPMLLYMDLAAVGAQGVNE